jgi:signal transduction histidine kinase
VAIGPLLERVVLLEQRVPVEFDPGPAAILSADPDQLEQMFINLLRNAVDASLANGAKPVRASWSCVDSSIVVTIEDQGLGIANTDNLFVPFYTTKPAGSAGARRRGAACEPRRRRGCAGHGSASAGGAAQRVAHQITLRQALGF